MKLMTNKLDSYPPKGITKYGFVIRHTKSGLLFFCHTKLQGMCYTSDWDKAWFTESFDTADTVAKYLTEQNGEEYVPVNHIHT